jgi:hypothetical protein
MVTTRKTDGLIQKLVNTLPITLPKHDILASKGRVGAAKSISTANSSSVMSDSGWISFFAKTSEHPRAMQAQEKSMLKYQVFMIG